jgi:hypothetical protein
LYKETTERRGADRFPMDREVRYKLLHGKNPDEGGAGKTIDMSSSGVSFTTDRPVLTGKTIEVSISWPAQLNSGTPLKLVTRGRVIRSEAGKAAIEIHHSEFRTQATHSLKPAGH